jgi:ComF family protein
MLTQSLKKTMRRYLRRQCPLCELPLEHPENHWCQTCLQWFSPQPRCARCGLVMPEPTEQCGQCLQSPPPWNRLYCLGGYTYPLNNFVHQIKYQRQFWQIPPLTQLLAGRISHPATCLTSVPLHWRRQFYRGFNQSDLIARHLSQELHIPHQSTLTRRHRATPQQKGLDKQTRRVNLQGAFTLRHSPDMSHLAIVDDVVTTGNTVGQLCLLFRQAGVEQIDIYCLCRTSKI